VITAQTVAQTLPDEGAIGVVLRSDLNQILLDRADFQIAPGLLKQKSGSVSLPLSDHAVRRIGDIKRFYETAASPQPTRETYVIHGFSNELTMTELPLDCFDMIYSFTSVTEPVNVLNWSTPDTPGKLTLANDARADSLTLRTLNGSGVWRYGSLPTSPTLVGTVTLPPLAVDDGEAFDWKALENDVSGSQWTIHQA
jgi:hypothetical protein